VRRLIEITTIPNIAVTTSIDNHHGILCLGLAFARVRGRVRARAAVRRVVLRPRVERVPLSQ
jgi:hypothetical protein